MWNHLDTTFAALRRTLGGALLLAAGLGSAHAATTTYIVDTLAEGTADANVGDGVCLTAAGECSLRAALEEANALPASEGDDIRIEFAEGLSGDIVHSGGTPRMFDETLGNTAINNYIGFGAFLHVNASRPLALDFDERIELLQNNDSEYAMLFIESDDVVVENFDDAEKRDIAGAGVASAGGIMAAGTAIVIGGSRVTLRNGLSSDPGTIIMESCIALVDGASDVTVEDFYCRSSVLFGIYFDERGTYSNIALTGFETQGGQGFGDIWVEFGTDEEKTVVNGLTITDSEFRSQANQGLDYTIGIRENSVVSDLVITESRFIAADTFGIGIFPTAVTNGLSVSGSTIDGTRQFIRDDGRTLQTGMTVSGNTFTSVSDDIVILNSPHQDALIENNQFLDSRGAGNVAGVRVEPIASGSNNVIRGNTFSQEEPTNKFAIWMRANPGVDLPTGWSIQDNAVVNIIGSLFGPIFLEFDGNTLTSGNTFGEGTRGADVDNLAPENDDSFFVVNRNAGTNDRIQTWRATGAVFTGTTVRVAVAPVTELRPGNTEPTLPVSIDVYYSATNQAETYLGRIPGTHSTETVFEFTSDATAGAVRAQITDAEGRSSQYSASTSVVMGVDTAADDDMDGLPNGAECEINLLGIPITCRDSDLDGTPDFQDPDDDNDGIPTLIECPTGSPCVNTDGGPRENHRDLDSDGDGISDANECPDQPCRDTDGDGVANYVDLDSDGDGLDDQMECPLGVACPDDDENGVEDYLEPPGTTVLRGTGGGAAGPWMLVLLGGIALLRRRRMLAPLAGLIALLGAFSAQAAGTQDWTSRLYGGAMVGGLFTDFDEGGLNRALQDAGFNLEPIGDDSESVGYGFWVGYALNSYLGLELSYTTGADEQVEFSGSVGGDDLQAALDVAEPFLTGYGDTYLVRLRYHHALNDRWFVSPHVGAGITQTRDTLDSRDQRAKLDEDSFTWALGGGIHYALTPDWSLGVGADYYQASSDNAYTVVSGIVEWRFPRALRPHVPVLPPPDREPVRVVPLTE